MTYKYNLQKVLDYRLKSEDEEHRRLAGLFQEVDEARAQLNFFREELAYFQTEYSSGQKEQVNVLATMLASNYITFMNDRIKEQEQLLEKCEGRLKEQIHLTEKAMKERKTMDTLRDKDYARYRNELRVSEQRQNDEIACLSHIRVNRNHS